MKPMKVGRGKKGYTKFKIHRKNKNNEQSSRTANAEQQDRKWKQLELFPGTTDEQPSTGNTVPNSRNARNRIHGNTGKVSGNKKV